jgi:hypothetical protein
MEQPSNRAKDKLGQLQGNLVVRNILMEIKLENLNGLE